MTNILAGNWKMNLPPSAAAALAESLVPVAAELQNTEMLLAPAAIAIPATVAACGSASSIAIGAQNIHWEDSGAYTGELSISMLQDAGGSFTLVGHSERRHVFQESDQMVNRRALYALAQGLSTILCIGETLEERKAGQTTAVLQRQLSEVVAQYRDDFGRLVFAYEPVWAIGTGEVATIAEIEQAHDDVQSFWKGNQSGACPPILYGGSVKPENYAEIISLPNVQGALVGGASLSLEQFSALAQISERSA